MNKKIIITGVLGVLLLFILLIGGLKAVETYKYKKICKKWEKNQTLLCYKYSTTSSVYYAVNSKGTVMPVVGANTVPTFHKLINKKGGWVLKGNKICKKGFCFKVLNCE